MQFSHSRLECFESCKFKYKLRYIDRIRTIPDDKADNALILGHALHTGIEQGVEQGIREYLMAFPIITDDHITEAMKLEYWIPRARAMLPQGECELPLLHTHFTGYIDRLSPVTMFHDSEVPNLFDIYDYKYTGNGAKYRLSDQLHLYKYFFERQYPGKKIRSLYYVIIPKVSIKPKKGETLERYRERIESELSKKEITLIPVEYDPANVIDFFMRGKELLEAQEFPKEPQYFCNWCEYQEYCQKGVDYMLLPDNKRRPLNAIAKKVVWLYGAPFSGKTFFANTFPDPLMLNTDGNIKFVDAPFIPIRDKVEVTGRMTKRTLAWEIFKEVISELEKKENGFKTIVIDLLEDVYEACRLYMYGQLGITHESDDSFRAWDKVRTEFLSTLKKLMALDYENIILISHEDTTKDITKRDGKLTAIKPNMQDKVSNKVAGMVDIVARVIADSDMRILSFKNNEVIFGGGRLSVKANEIPLDYEAFCAVYAEANQTATAVLNGEAPANTPADTGRKGRASRKQDDPPAPTPITEEAPAPAPEKGEEHPPVAPETAAAETPAPDEKPVRTRKRRTEAG